MCSCEYTYFFYEKNRAGCDLLYRLCISLGIVFAFQLVDFVVIAEVEA